MTTTRKLISNNQTYQLDPTKVYLGDLISSGITALIYQGEYNGANVAIKVEKLNSPMERSFAPSKKYIKNEKFFLEFFAELQKNEPNNKNASRIIGYFGFCELNTPRPQTYLVIQHANKGNLENYISTTSSSSCRWYHDGKNLLKQIIEGLSYLHSNNVIYADLHSSNILLHLEHSSNNISDSKTMNVLLSDFGIARIKGDKTPSSDASPPYCPPEIWEGLPCTEKSDVYQLGCLAYEITHWKIIFKDEKFTRIDDIKNHVYWLDLRPSLSNDCSVLSARYIQRCWQKNPHIRPTLEEGLTMIENDTPPQKNSYS